MVEAGDLGRPRPGDVRPIGHDRGHRRGRRGASSPASSLAVVLARMLARPLAEVGARRPPDRRRRLRGPGPARGPGGDRQPRRFVQPDGRQPRAPGDDAARLHRQRRARAADAADQPAGLSRGAARRRHRRRPGDLRLAVGRGRAARPPVALARRAGRGRRRDRRRRGSRSSTSRRPIRAAARARPADARSGRPRRRASTSRTACPPAPTPTTSPRSWPTCCRTPPATRRAGGDGHGPRRAPRRRTCSCRSSNTGDGIPPDDLERVFERFYRVEKSRDRARGGAGIGLAIVKQLVEAGGGRVGAESRDGQTRFWFSLPA